jgi:hypothetical protein
LAVSFEDFSLTEYAEWILEQRYGYRIFTRKLEGIYFLILKRECGVKIDFTESGLNICIGLDWEERVRWITFESDGHLQKKRIYTESIQQLPDTSEIDTIIECLL